jgi:hypothetical protein
MRVRQLLGQASFSQTMPRARPLNFTYYCRAWVVHWRGKWTPAGATQRAAHPRIPLAPIPTTPCRSLPADDSDDDDFDSEEEDEDEEDEEDEDGEDAPKLVAMANGNKGRKMMELEAEEEDDDEEGVYVCVCVHVGVQLAHFADRCRASVKSGTWGVECLCRLD